VKDNPGYLLSVQSLAGAYTVTMLALRISHGPSVLTITVFTLVGNCRADEPDRPTIACAVANGHPRRGRSEGNTYGPGRLA
jgi:hypothetical protein